ncbi:MAG: aldehyde reductase [Myxococcota bacterium]
MADSSRTAQPGDLVCVTGASGFIASHIVAELLRQGYRVRGTVRNPSDEAKTAHLRAIETETGGQLELVAGDLMQPGAFDEAVAGCPFVCHTASSVRLAADDPQREIVDVAVQGTLNVLGSVAKAGEAHRVVVTSSVAAIIDEEVQDEVYFTEEHWNESARVDVNPYPLSKTEAERAAWTFVDEQPADHRFELVTINPSWVLGPVLAKVHGRSSPAVMRDLLTGKFPMTPKLAFNLVDVRDVALAHVRALQRPDAAGRFIINNQRKILPELSAMLREDFPGKKVPRFAMPNPLMYVVALFDKRITWSFLRKNLDAVTRLDNGKSLKVLGIDYRPVRETVRDTGQAFIDLGEA